jgi:pilin isopeptide linkage protein
VTSMYSMFQDCSALTSITLGQKNALRGSGSTRADGLDGTWINEGSGLTKTFTELTNLGPDLSADEQGTWTKVVSSAESAVLFDAQGGVVDGDAYVKQSNANPVTVPSAMRPNYLFVEWNTKADGTGTAYAPGSTVTPFLGHTTVLYARWAKSVPYTRVERIESLAHPGTYEVTGRVTAMALEGTQTIEAPAKTGFVTPAAQTVNVASDGSTTVTFDYARKRFTVTLDGNGFFSPAHTQDALGGVRLGLAAAPAVEGKRFIGWTTNADGSGDMFADRQKVLFDGSVTLYANYVDEDDYTADGIDRVIRVKVRGGETVTIPNLPAGAAYEVREVNVPAGWTQTGIVGETGTIAANVTSQVSATNRYVASGSFTIEAHKALEGAELKDAQFSFQLLDSTGRVLQTVANGEPDIRETVADPATGTATINPHHNQGPVVFDEIEVTTPGIYTYRVREVATTDGSIVSDAHVETVTVNVTDNGDGTLAAAVSYDADGCVFVNRQLPGNPEKTGSLEVSKVVLGATEASSDQTFTFDVTLTDPRGNPVSGTFGAVTFVDGAADAVLAGGEKLTVTDIPEGVTYRVTERDLPSGWTLYGKTGETGTIVEDGTARAVFTNEYRAFGAFTVRATKLFPGGSLEDNEFVFVLEDDNDAEVARVTSNASGAVVFDNLPIETSWANTTRTYHVRELAGDDNAIAYDGHVEDVTVAFADDGAGHLSATVTYDGDGCVFTNEPIVTIHLPGTGRGGISAVMVGYALAFVVIGCSVVVARRKLRS